MPMNTPEDHGGEDETIEYCKHCAPNGELRDRIEIREGWITAVIKMENIPRYAAEKKVDEAMRKMPAWIEQKKHH